MALTERQQQIVGLQKQGKKAKEIGSDLGISENAVYQQLRRIRKGSGAATTPRRQSAAKPAAAEAAPAATVQPPANVAKPVTPLQAIRARRDEITSSVRELESQVTSAQSALEKATVARDKAVERNRAELAGLDAAEAALKGELSLPEAAIEVGQAVAGATAPEAPAEPAKATSNGKGSGKGRRSAQDAADAAEADAAQGAAEAPVPAAA